MKDIRLGYELISGGEVRITPSHMIVTGVSQKSGKTTTLESLIMRSGKKAIVFRTKIGEKSFLSGTIIPPYFKDRSDWQFVQGLIEATIKEKLRSFERAKIIQICKQTGGNSLLEFKKRVDQRLQEKINNFELDILTNVQAYLEIVLPKLQSINFSNQLELIEGLNIIDLERFSRDAEVQSLIIRSVLDEVLHKFKDVIIVIPEAWKFIPQDRGSPCKLIVEEFVRQGATNGNFVWIDSQDMTGVDKTPLKQISTYILGYQSEPNEVKKTLDTIPLPKAVKPKPDEIMSLGKGVFILAERERTVKVYVQPFWLDDERSQKVAKGEIKIDEIDVPETITPFKIAIKKDETQQEKIDLQETAKRFSKELSEMSTDFFNKIADLQEQINKVYTEIYKTKTQIQPIDEESIIRKVLQKMPIQPLHTNQSIDKESMIKEILNRIPKAGNIVYEIAPIEKIKKDFIHVAKTRIIDDVSKLSDESKKMLKYLESRNVELTVNELCMKCFLMKQSGGGYGQTVNNYGKELTECFLAEKKQSGRFKGSLKTRINELLQVHEATNDEIENLYNHVIMEMLSIGVKN